MNQRLPGDAFSYYVALGSDRSYRAVADHFDVNKRTVVRTAQREDWARRLEAIEKKARDSADEKLATDLEEMALRHRKMLKAMAARAARAIADFPLTSGMEGVKTAELVIKLERVLAGEPSDRSQISIEKIIKGEMDRLLVADDGQGDGDADDY